MEHEPRTRLAPINNHAELKPWRKAAVRDFHAYWLSADFPMRLEQRRWMQAFFELFSETTAQRWGLSARVFIPVKTISPDLTDDFLKMSQNFTPLLGLERRGNLLPGKRPDQESITALQSGRLQFRFEDYAPDYCYWFSGQRPKEQYHTFAGFGGLTVGFTKSESNPELFQSFLPPSIQSNPGLEKFLKMNVRAGEQDIVQAVTEPFLKKSKELFGQGLESLPQFPGLLFILPQLEAQDCFSQPTQIKDCLSVFNIYIRESVADGGILLISAHDCDEELVKLTAVLKNNATVYEHGKH